MTDHKTYAVSPQFSRDSFMTESQYRNAYAHSLSDPEKFWSEQARQYITWFTEWKTVFSGGFENLNMRWFEGAQLNVAYNCLDRHLKTRAQQAAIIWEGDDASESKIITYQQLYEQVCQFSNVLKTHGVKKGDRVCIYLPMIPEVAVAMLACARIGAVHSVVFGGFSADALKTRILDADCQLVVTANEGIRGNKIIPLKTQVDLALQDCPKVRKVIVVKRTESRVSWNDARDIDYQVAMSTASTVCDPVTMDAQDPLFILYTSGSTGKPKGILHGTGGYLLYAAMTQKLIFDCHENDVFWCTADVGWITGHSYVIYGPLANGATTLLFEGVPSYPTPARFWEVIDKHQVTIFYTAPTAIRALRREGDAWLNHSSRKSLRVLGSVGEPINPETWEWYYHAVGKARCPIVDTWWQTETGSILISALPGATPLKPGSAAWPFFGIVPAILDEEGKPLPDGEMGKLAIKQAWPGMLQTIYQNPSRFESAYFKECPGYYLTGDLAFRDTDGYYWISGRSDDVLKISGHRIGSQEVESALVNHPSVSEAAVVPIPDEIKGQSIYAFVTLKNGIQASDALKKELDQTVKTSIGAIAIPGHIQFTDGMPKTRSGKILRRLLRKIANHELNDLGDLSTLADPSVVDALIKQKK